MSARVIVEQSKRLREGAGPGIQGGFEAPVAAPSLTLEDAEKFPIDQDYQLEDGEAWVDDDQDIGAAYVTPTIYDEVPLPDEVLSPADELLGELPMELGEEVDPLGTNVGLASQVSDAEDHGQPFDSEGVVVQESFKIPGTGKKSEGLILNKGDMILKVEVTDPSFQTIKLIKESAGEETPEDVMKEIAYGKKDGKVIEAEDDEDDNGVVVDDDKKLAYVEARVNFKVPGLGKNLVVMFEKGDRFIVRSRFVEDMEPNDVTKGDEAAAAQDGGKPAEVAADLATAGTAITTGTPGLADDLGIVKEGKDGKPFPGAAPPFKKKEGEEAKKYDKDGKEDPDGEYDKDGKKLSEAEDEDKEDEPDPKDPKEGDEPKEENAGGKAKPGFSGLAEDKDLTSRRTSRSIKFSLRQKPSGTAWN